MMCKNTMSSNTQVQCSSPVAVFDFSAVFQLDQIESLKLQAPSMMMRELPPPVDSITACPTEDSDSVSSISTGAAQEEITANSIDEKVLLEKDVAPKRSIFSKYWDKTGETPVKPQNRMASLRRQRAVAGEMDKARTFFSSQPSDTEEEEDMDFAMNSSIRTQCSQEQKPRRSIFGHTLQPSLRSLPTMANNDGSEQMRTVFYRKARSASTLQERPPPSCLRPRRGPRRRSSSVSFDEKISVVIFQKPQEQFSDDGWEALFCA